ncbi:MAG: TIGR04076 family protein [Methanotrichaceae archaeon]|nr:TIGR04076 family protein [Methanotrichaceae archaeon]
MAAYKIKCEVISIGEDREKCIGAAKMKKGETFIFQARTPEGMCVRAFNAVFPSAFAMRYSEKMPWEKKEGYADITCPDGDVVIRISRIREEPVQI